MLLARSCAACAGGAPAWQRTNACCSPRAASSRNAPHRVQGQLCVHLIATRCPCCCPLCPLCRQLESPETMTSAKLIERIVANRALFEERQAKKTKSEAAYYQTSKTYLQEI